MRLIKLFSTDERGAMVTDVAKAALAIAFLSVVAANLVSTQTGPLDRDRLHQVATAAARGQVIDPLVTGSLQKRAGETRLDPCVATR